MRAAVVDNGVLRIEERPDPAPGPGQVLVRIDRFAFTANNVTYGVAGDMLNYWSFFPAEEGWGRIPVWGFGDVVRSSHDAVGGEHAGGGDRGVIDGGEHREVGRTRLLDSRRDPTGLSPDPAVTQEAVIQVFAAPAVSWRGTRGTRRRIRSC